MPVTGGLPFWHLPLGLRFFPRDGAGSSPHLPALALPLWSFSHGASRLPPALCFVDSMHFRSSRPEELLILAPFLVRMRGWQTFSVRGWIVNIWGFVGYTVCHNYLAQPLYHESIHRQYINEWASLYLPEPLFGML